MASKREAPGPPKRGRTAPRRPDAADGAPLPAVVRSLEALGLSPYEAKIYVALLRHGPQNGNELSKRSGVPSSKVYSTVEKMVRHGFVHSVTGSDGTRFVGIAPGELVGRLRRRYNEPIDFLEQALPPLTQFEPGELFLNVAGREAIFETARALIDSGVSEIHLSLWHDELEALRPALAAADGRSVRIFGMLYSPDDALPPGSWIRHSYEAIVANRIGGRMLTLVKDGDEALVARLSRDGDASAVRTRSPVLTLIAQEYLHHDMVLQRAQIAIGFDEWDRWWQADPELRSVILGTAIARANERAPGTPDVVG